MVEKEDKTGISRRQLIKGATVGALVGLGPKMAEAAQPSTKWDKEADVVIVGSGTGLVGALAATVAGDKVVVIEKMAIPGGSMGISGGVTWVPNNPLMRKAGIPDSRENALSYTRVNSQGQADEELLAAFVDHGPEMVDFVAANTPMAWEIYSSFAHDAHPEWPGGVRRGRSLLPVSNIKGLRGGVITQALLGGCKAKKFELLLETSAKKLLTRIMPDGSQEVLGLHAESNGKTINIKAKKGVILAAGGYDWNFEMKKHFLRGPTPYTVGAPGLMGDGIRMGMSIGADLRNMNQAWGLPVYKEEAEIRLQRNAPATITLYSGDKALPGTIMVNRYGERFCNEAGSGPPIWRSLFGFENWGGLRYHNLPAFLIMDHKCRTKYGIAGMKADNPLPPWVKKADTLHELAKILSIDPDELLKTVSEFNNNAMTGKDPAFHRGESTYDFASPGSNRTGDGPGATLAPLEAPPFYGAEVAAGDVGTAGGLRVNKNSQVLTPFGQAIPRLYACGNNSGVGGPGADYGGSGGTLGPGMTFAYIAGKHVVTLTPWK